MDKRLIVMKKLFIEETLHVDSIAVTKQCSLNAEADAFTLIGLSSLEGNIWDGAIRLIANTVSQGTTFAN